MEAEKIQKKQRKKEEEAENSTLTALKGLLAPLTSKLDALSLKVDKAVTKEDLETWKQGVVREVKQEVKTEVSKQVKAAVSAGSLGGNSSKETEELWRLLDRTDPAKIKVALKGFSETVSENVRLAELEKKFQ